MRSIKFSDLELDFLKGHYEQELRDVEKYADELKAMLRKLGGKVAAVTAEKPEKKKRGRRGRPRKVAAEQPVLAVKKEKVKVAEAKKKVKKAPVKKKKVAPKKATSAPKPEKKAVTAPVAEAPAI